MARLVVASAFGVVVGIVAGAACGLHAQETPADDDVTTAANEAGVDPTDLLGAMNTTGLGARDYLYAVHELERPYTPPAAPLGWPIGGTLGQRIWCIEGIESRHGAAMYNPMPWHGEHAQGYLGWLPSTARSVGVIIGNRPSEWAGAARMIASGRGREFFGIGAGIC